MVDTTSAPQPIAYIDTETDGLHFGKQAWEIAIIRRDFHPASAPGAAPAGWTETRCHAMLPLPSMRTSDPYALNVGGFWDRHPRGRELSGKDPIPGPGLDSPRLVADTVFRLTYGAHLVGVNPAFDAEVLTTLLRDHGLVPKWDYHLGDLVAETAGYLRGQLALDPHRVVPGPDGPVAAADVLSLPWKSDRLAAAVGVTPATDEDRHTAMGDALWALRWHDTLTGLATAEEAVA